MTIKDQQLLEEAYKKINEGTENFNQAIEQSDFNFMEEHDTFGQSLDIAISELMDNVMDLINGLPSEHRKKAKNVAARYIKSVAFDKINEADRNHGVSL